MWQPHWLSWPCWGSMVRSLFSLNIFHSSHIESVSMFPPEDQEGPVLKCTKLQKRITTTWKMDWILLPSLAKLKLLLRLSELYCILSTWSSSTPVLSWFSILLHSWFSSIAPKSPWNWLIHMFVPLFHINLDKVSASPPVVVVGDRTPSQAVVVETLVSVNHDVQCYVLYPRGSSDH